VVKQWGRIGAAGWQGGRTVEVAGEAEEIEVVQETLKRRQQHGYKIAGEG
jgi:hypothetical protein